jgi:hypothetical protein
VFAAAEVQQALLQQTGDGLSVVLKVDNKQEMGKEAYRIDRPAADTVRVTGSNAVGTMYGGLDVAEAIRLRTINELEPGLRKPHVEVRGIKFNIPLDLRTPSYSDCSDAAQDNIPEMWNLDFWQTTLDELARHHFNTLTLWNLHPFPSLVKVPEYPDVALNDVLRARRELIHQGRFSHSGSDMFRPALMDGAEMVKTLTIDEKIQFWRNVMQLASDRGIDVYLFTWNAFLFGADGKHGLNRQQPDENMIRYFRASVRETLKTYPLLAGIGITAGEHMEPKMAGRDKEGWLWDTYGEGIRDALRQQPGREFRLVHRFHQTSAQQILNRWSSYPSRFELSYKYSVAHMYSIPKPIFIREVLPELGDGLRTWLTVRNDDIYSFRWGDPEFARQYIRNFPEADKCIGFYMGPDGYTWGRDFLTKNSNGERQTVIEKQWYSFLIWGRIAYDPDLTDEYFQRVLAHRFPKADAVQLDQAWRAASRVFPLITRFVWGRIDVHWLPEACLSHPSYRGFYTVREFIERDPMPGSGVVGIKAWRRATLDGKAIVETSPRQIAEQLAASANLVRAALPGLRRSALQDSELNATLNDLEMFAQLGDYYAQKTHAACDLALYDSTGEKALQESALQHLQAALGHWQDYAESYAAQYQQRVLYNRVGWVDRTALIEDVKKDIQIAETWQPGSMPADQPAHPANLRAD